MLLPFIVSNLLFPAYVLSQPSFELNIMLPDSAYNLEILDQFEQNLGVKFQSVKWYLDWSNSFTPDVAKQIYAHGAIPELTWEPQKNDTGIANTSVVAGNYDTYLTNFAQSVKSLNFPIRINFAPEMNTPWVSWGFGKQGNNPTNFKDFWQHVVQKFRDNGVSNVRWVWTPNIHYYGDPYSFASFYPGDSFIDYLGLDGYNWGTTQSDSTWQSFQDVFQSSYNDLTHLSGKDILIMEIASTEKGGNKADWITNMFAVIPTSFPKIKGITWFNLNKETDWRIESSSESKQAFIRGASANSPPVPTNTSTPTPKKALRTKPKQSTVSSSTTTPATPESTPAPTDAPTDDDSADEPDQEASAERYAPSGSGYNRQWNFARAYSSDPFPTSDSPLARAETQFYFLQLICAGAILLWVIQAHRYRKSLPYVR